MASCSERKKSDGSYCGRPLNECLHCGTVGCDNEGCSGQNFDKGNGKCKKCGTYNSNLR